VAPEYPSRGKARPSRRASFNGTLLRVVLDYGFRRNRAYQRDYAMRQGSETVILMRSTVMSGLDS